MQTRDGEAGCVVPHRRLWGRTDPAGPEGRQARSLPVAQGLPEIMIHVSSGAHHPQLPPWGGMDTSLLRHLDNPKSLLQRLVKGQAPLSSEPSPLPSLLFR